jgi:hypothetical protein
VIYGTNLIARSKRREILPSWKTGLAAGNRIWGETGGQVIDGTREKLDAAEALKKKLELILKGENPYDIFIRWKPLGDRS